MRVRGLDVGGRGRDGVVREVVQHHHVGARRRGFHGLGDRLALDLDFHGKTGRLAGFFHRVGDAASRPDVVVLGHKNARGVEGRGRSEPLFRPSCWLGRRSEEKRSECDAHLQHDHL